MADSSVLKPGEVIKPFAPLNVVENLLGLYGFRAKQVKELNAYDDKNFYVQVHEEHGNPHVQELCPHGYVLKILNSLDSKKPNLTDAHNEMMKHLHSKGFNINSPVPNVKGEFKSLETFKTSDGKSETENIVRLLTFVPGVIQYSLGCTSFEMCYQVGKLAASIDNALQDFYHPAYDGHRTIWMLDVMPKILQFLAAVKDNGRKSMIQSVVREFETEVISKLDQLPKGMIHGDLNEQNLIVQKSNLDPEKYEIFGFLDVGDSQCNCYLFELVLTTMYQMLMADNSEFIQAGGKVIAGYLHSRSISELEWSLLKICIEARYCQSLVMGAYTSQQEPDNSYVLITSRKGWTQLEMLRKTSKDELLKSWRQGIQC